MPPSDPFLDTAPRCTDEESEEAERTTKQIGVPGQAEDQVVRAFGPGCSTIRLMGRWMAALLAGSTASLLFQTAGGAVGSRTRGQAWDEAKLVQAYTNVVAPVPKFLLRGTLGSSTWEEDRTITHRPSTQLPANVGILMGTAIPCSPPPAPGTSHTWTAHVVLRHGGKVVGSRNVTDSMSDGSEPNQRTIDQPFSFREPAGTYTIYGPNTTKLTVVIRSRTTTGVTLERFCP